MDNELKEYINFLRGGSIMRVMLGHLGLLWFYMPYSSWIGLLLPVLFFVSGLVSYHCYLRYASLTDYLYKRSIGIYLPYLIVALAILLVSLFIPQWDVGNFTRWLLIRPDTKELPFELGQVWFLRVLIIIVFLSAFIFALKNKGIYFAILLSLVVIVINSIIDVRNFFDVFSINFYLVFSNLYFFLLGSSFLLILKYDVLKILKYIAIISLIVFIFCLFFWGYTNLNPLKRNPELTYVSGATCLIAALMYYMHFVYRMCNQFKLIKAVLNFCSNNSYSLFLLHTIVLGLSELIIFTEPLTGNHKMAMLKLILVLIGTAILAPPLTRLTRQATLLCLGGTTKASSQNKI
ncbi:MAG: acyltransferase [Thalassotalea sp.]|nr:acyltransferase [Thalassotalea sp.]